MAASMATDRSSSTRDLLCDASTEATGMRIFRMLQVNLGLAENESVEAILLPAGDLEMTLCLPQERECMRGLRVMSSRLSFSFSSVNLYALPSLNEWRTTACRVV